jgi:FixJ family two-component response regulator
MIYVIDDDVAVLKSLRFLLETEGFDVRAFSSGLALLESSVLHGADCLVLDYKMAGIDGLELSSRLRGLGIDTPIILITGHPDANIRTKASFAGVGQVVLKPDLQDNLVECVRDAIDSHMRPPEEGMSTP